MVVAYSTEGLLVSHGQLDAAIGVIRTICESAGFSPDVSVSIERDPEVPSAPVQLLTVFVPELTPEPVRFANRIAVMVTSGLRQAGLHSPNLPLEAFVIPGW